MKHAWCLALALAGCTGSFQTVAGRTVETHARGPQGSAAGAHVRLLETDDDLVVVLVTNVGATRLLIERENMLLRLPNGKHRTPLMFHGDDTYVLEPGESHRVNVRFSLNGPEDGDLVFVEVSEALSSNGKLLEGKPIALTIRD
jgi:hypothetical protein